MLEKESPEIFFIDEKRQTASEELAELLTYCIRHTEKEFSGVVFLCIGSDRITGDSLGPLTGHLLAPHCKPGFSVYGTLDDPIHALNLENRFQAIRKKHPRELIVAIDASLGSRRHQGFISVGTGSIRPGAGAGKELPEVGNVFITGIVNISGCFEQLLLQTTRLSTVFRLANVIAEGILLSFSRTEAACSAAL